MTFPARPTCHPDPGEAFKDHLRKFEWRAPDADRPFRTCRYCGSIHPEDLLKAIEAGGKVGGSDWKYGWPHKFYVDVPGKPDGGTYFGKWYNDHLKDAGFDDETLNRLIAVLADKSGIRFQVVEKDGVPTLMYSAPARGYQR